MNIVQYMGHINKVTSRMYKTIITMMKMKRKLQEIINTGYIKTKQRTSHSKGTGKKTVTGCIQATNRTGKRK